MSAHSALGPSSAHRWLVCPGSINAERIVRLDNPTIDSSSVYAEEGTRAHELAEKLLLNPELPHAGDAIDRMDDQDMLRYALQYREYCQAQGTPESLNFVESQVAMPRVHKDCWGTADYATYVQQYKHLHVIDLKYGQGIAVHAERNPQAMLYAEGVRQMLYDEHGIKPKHFTVHIYQPRLREGENISTYSFSNLALDDFITHCAEAALRTKSDTDVFVPGDKQCQWCIANPCAARSSQMLTMLAAEFEDLDEQVDQLTHDSPLLSDQDLAQWLDKAKTLKAFIARIEALGYERAINDHVIPGYKLVDGRGRYVGDESKLAFLLGNAAYKPPTLKSKSELEKHMGRKRFNTIAADYFQRQPGKPSLVPESDARPAWSSLSDAQAMFDEL